jgi:hypothetical protein
MGSIVFLMQVFIHKGGRGIAVNWRLTFISGSSPSWDPSSSSCRSSFINREAWRNTAVS